MIKSGVVGIKGNSFGPYFPKSFFEEDTYKILWLLKESFIEGPSFEAGDRGAHNQAAEYAHYTFEYDSLGEGYETHPRLVEYTKQLLISLKKLPEDCSILDVMRNICILEMNHFPGLAFNSKNSDPNDNYAENLVAKWSRKNKELIHTLVDFYNPSIIIFGYSLEYFEEFYDFEKVFQRYTDNKLEIFGDRIIEISYIDSVTDEKVIFREADKYTINKKIEENKKIIGKNKFNVGRNIKYLGESGRIYIQAYHPSARYGKFKPKFAIKDAAVIKEWKSLKSKENGVKNPTTV